jgi:hypothetical protein
MDCDYPNDHEDKEAQHCTDDGRVCPKIVSVKLSEQGRSDKQAYNIRNFYIVFCERERHGPNGGDELSPTS